MPAQRHPKVRRQGAGRWAAWLLGLTGVLISPAAWSVITTVGGNTGVLDPEHRLTLRVDAAGGVDTVSFDVTGNNIALTPSPVVGTPDIDVWVLPLRPWGWYQPERPVRLWVDSSGPGLVCESPSCGSTVIPFNKISWVASNTSGGPRDIVTGAFTGATQQSLAAFDANANPCPLGVCIGHSTRQLQATRLRFSYANDVLYPAGSYRGTVRFTAVME